MRVARSGLWLRVWASRNCLLEESKRLSASIPALRAGKARARVETKEACRRLVGSMWTGGSARAHSRSQDSLSCRHEREPWEQGWLLARLLEYKVVNYDAIELVAAINRFVVY